MNDKNNNIRLMIQRLEEEKNCLMLALTYHMNIEHDSYMYISLHLEITSQFM